MAQQMWIMAALALALGACGDRTAADKGAADQEASAAQESAAPPQSIIRADVEPPVVEPQLEPLTARISFADGGSELSEEASAELAQLLATPQMGAGGAIVLRGHSDAGGNDAINLRLSTERGQAVADWLIGEGISEGRITVIGFGEQNPVEPNALPDGTPDERGRAANRRVDVTIELPGEDPPTPADGGAPADAEEVQA